MHELHYDLCILLLFLAGLQWKNTKEEMNKHLSILEHCHEYVSNPAYNFIRANSTEAYVPNIIKGEFCIWAVKSRKHPLRRALSPSIFLIMSAPQVCARPFPRSCARTESWS